MITTPRPDHGDGGYYRILWDAQSKKQWALKKLRHALHYVWARHDEDAAQVLARCFIGVLYGD
jgi:hypothetical protein